MTSPVAPRARILVLAGPSGAGKSRLAQRLNQSYGWPVVALDDFYADIGDPDLPMSPLGLPDWDDVRSWRADAAIEALTTLCHTGHAEVPIYDISTSKTVGRHRLTCDGAPVIIAEGIFAATIVHALRDRDLVAAAWCVRNRPWVTFGRRLVRDLAERRKPPVTLWRRGQILRRAEPGIVKSHQELGATPLTARQAERISPLLATDVRAGMDGGHRGTG